MFFIMYTCITTLCGNAVQQLKNVICLHFKRWRIWKKRNTVSFEMSANNVNNKIPDVTYNYKEFREPLIAVSD